jgi:predicted HicB family RNase H-like nuclease
MNNTMEYKGYVGSVEFSETDQILFGKVQGIRSLISYEGTTVSELIEDFRDAVDDYLELCSEEGIKPEKAYKGSFNVRFKNPDLHKKAAVYAYNHNVSLNSVVEESVAEYLVARQS